MSTLRIQPLNLDDARQTHDFLDLLDHYMQGPSGNGAAMDAALRERLPAALRNQPTVLSYLAYWDGEAAGLINCVLGFSTFAARPLLNVHDLVVHRDFRRRGIGRALLAHAEAVAQDRGCCKLTLEVLEGNTAAREAYLEFGFQPYRLDPAMGSAQFMEKKLAVVRG
jgi:GNAT superfamily N-acetyltransferase